MRNGQTTTAVAPRPGRHPGNPVDVGPRSTGSLGLVAARAHDIHERARGIADELREIEFSLVGSRPSTDQNMKALPDGVPGADSFANRTGCSLEGIDRQLGEILLSIGRIREEL